MKALSILTALLLLAGCRDLAVIDTTPPTPPRGINSLALDNEVQLQWQSNTEHDMAGYHVWSSGAYDGKYELLGTTSGTSFSDLRAHNGITYFYAVSAYDYNENESDLSYEEVAETPRPEGFDIVLYEAVSTPALSGYDFSTYSIGKYNDQYTDFFYEESDNAFYLSVWNDTDIQDMGYTSSFDEIRVAPSQGWSPSRTAEAIVGHTYVVWTWDNHFAKVRVTSIAPSKIVFDWSYQLDGGNRHLKSARAAGSRKPLSR